MFEKSEVIRKLREEIRAIEGSVPSRQDPGVYFGLKPVEAAFPENRFPVGAVHEFSSQEATEAASTNGFIAGLLGRLMQKGGFCLWVSSERTVFPPGLKRFGVEPDRIIFIDVQREKEVLWAVEQGLKCNALVAVVGELKEIGFTDSQRLQLAVEQSRVTGFLHRYQPRGEHNLACAARWKITPILSGSENGMPGVGFPRWRVELIKVRNGRSGVWQLEWKGGEFHHIPLYEESIGLSKELHYA